jgi:hypothetical protein
MLAKWRGLIRGDGSSRDGAEIKMRATRLSKGYGISVVDHDGMIYLELWTENRTAGADPERFVISAVEAIDLIAKLAPAAKRALLARLDDDRHIYLELCAGADLERFVISPGEAIDLIAKLAPAAKRALLSRLNVR